MIDIDYFKNINDTHGHIAGDKVLKTFCNVVKAKIRNTDIFARWGGEEFIIVCPNTKLENALIIAENLRKLVKNTTFEGVKGITCSFGVAEFKQYETLDSLIKRADNALYTAKANGRDRVVKA
jgi:diguanylate cyclase (GGDEF)-like protein